MLEDLNYNVIKTIVSKGANIQLKNKKNETALMIALTKIKNETVKLLLKKTKVNSELIRHQLQKAKILADEKGLFWIKGLIDKKLHQINLPRKILQILEENTYQI